MLIREATNGIEEGIKINGQNINNLRYADDTVLISDSANGLQALIDRVVEACGRYNMKLNCKKTKILVVSKSDEIQHQFIANNETLETVNKVTYLQCSLNKEWYHSQEIRCRIERARTVFNRHRKIVCNMHLNGAMFSPRFYMEWKPGPWQKQHVNDWKPSKCGAIVECWEFRTPTMSQTIPWFNVWKKTWKS